MSQIVGSVINQNHSICEYLEDTKNYCCQNINYAVLQCEVKYWANAYNGIWSANMTNN